MAHSRTRVYLETCSDCTRFVSELNSDGTADKYVLENSDGEFVADARSLLGVMYASSDFGGEIYLVNLTHDNHYPICIDRYRN